MLGFQTSHCHLCLISIGMYEMSRTRCCSGSTVFHDKALSPSARGLLAHRAPPSGTLQRIQEVRSPRARPHRASLPRRSRSRSTARHPRSSKSISFTARADMSTGILRHHDAATLGVSQLTHTALFSANRSDFHTRNVHNMYKQIIGNNRK